MENFTAQALVNIAWSVATVQVSHEPLMNALASRSIARIAQFSGQGLSNPAWAVAPLPFRHAPLLTAISAQSISRIGSRCRGGEQHAAVFTPRDIAHTAWAFAELMF